MRCDNAEERSGRETRCAEATKGFVDKVSTRGDRERRRESESARFEKDFRLRQRCASCVRPEGFSFTDRKRIGDRM